MCQLSGRVQEASGSRSFSRCTRPAALSIHIRSRGTATKARTCRGSVIGLAVEMPAEKLQSVERRGAPNHVTIARETPPLRLILSRRIGNREPHRPDRLFRRAAVGPRDAG